MSEHAVSIQWQRNGANFVDNRYSRSHVWKFDGGAVVSASASPHVVPLPYSDPSGVDPEEAFIAAISSCHMLWFLLLAAQKGFTVELYQDEAIGIMGKNEQGRIAILKVTLRPQVEIIGSSRPSHDEFLALHHEAHEKCFIANSVRTEIQCEPILI